MSEAISSPPYPSEGTVNVRGLYRDLETLRCWVVLEQAELRRLVKPEAARELTVAAELESVARWEQVSVQDHFVVLRTVMQIRENYDAVLRDFENNWDVAPAVNRRYAIVKMAQMILTEAFVHPEHREMQQEKQRRAWQKLQDRAAKLQQKAAEMLAEETADSGDDSDWDVAGNQEEGEA